MSWFYSILVAGSLFGFNAVTDDGVHQVPVEAPAVIAFDETEKFEQTYQIGPTGRISVSNINGPITVETWEENRVKLVAVKTADTKDRLNDARIKIDSTENSLTVSTEYENSSSKVWGRYGKLNVDYHLTVPRGAVLDEIETVNGSITITNTTNLTKAKAVNGPIRATGLRGAASLSTVNGSIAAEFDQVSGKNRIVVSTVNGAASLSIPSDSNATVKADSLSGSIANEFGLPIRKGEYLGRDLFGRLGAGEAAIKLSTLNGQLSIKKNADGRTPSVVTDLLPEKKSSDDDIPELESLARMDEELAAANAEISKAMAEANREFEKVRPEIEKAALEAMKESMAAVEMTTKVMNPESLAKLKADAEKLRQEFRARYRRSSLSRTPPTVDYKTESFDVKGVPTVTINAGEADVDVRGWNKNTVEYTLTRFSSDRSPNPLSIKADRNGDEIKLALEALGCDSCQDFRIEVKVPVKSNLRIVSEGEIRLENVSGDIKVEGGSNSVNIRDAAGKLAVGNIDGRIRVIGFNGVAEASTEDGEISLEGDFSRLDAKAGDGEVIVTIPDTAGVTIRSNTRSVAASGLPFALAGSDGEMFTFRIGSGSSTFSFSAEGGRFVIRNAAAIRSAD